MTNLSKITEKLQEAAILTHQEALEWDKFIFTTISKPESHFSESLRHQYYKKCKEREEKINILKKELLELGHPIFNKSITIDIPRSHDLHVLINTLESKFKNRISCSEYPEVFSEKVFVLYIECTEKDLTKIFDSLLESGISKEIVQYGVIEDIDETIIPEIRSWTDAEKILLDSGKQYTYQIVEKANIDLFRMAHSPSEKTKLKDKEWTLLTNDEKIKLNIPKEKIERTTRKIFKY